jgi:hypothetical protein
MSAFSDQEPTSPQDPLHYAPRRRGERSGTRLRTVATSVGETKFDGPFRIDATSSPFAPPVPDAELEDAISETLRRHLAPQVMPEPAAFVRQRPRRNKSLMVGAGIVVAVGVAAVVAAFLVTVIPISRDRGAGSAVAAAAEFAFPNGAAKPARSQSRSVVVSGDGDHLTNEQSEQLLDRFIQWRQKTDAAQQQQ